tara:strand:+ start:153 stop:557 length:405 start_codon:yes stop_codon:yes gene_type:complete
MKLLLENWRKFITEDWRDTYWKTNYGKVTIGEIIDYLSDFETVDINVGELIEQLPTLPVGGGDIDEALNRMAAANLDYPIIIVKSAEKYEYVLDGNHRLGKAYVCGGKDSTIKAKILDVSAEAETPERFKKAFG